MAATDKSIYASLGIKPLINGQGTYTTLGGSLMPPEVVAAMAEAAGCFVSIPDLLEKAGDHIARLLGVPAALISAGAASAITAGTAACIAGDDQTALDRLPETAGLPNEVIIQRGHRSGYEPQILLSGARIVWVESRADLERSLSARTAMTFFVNRYEPLGSMKRQEWVKAGKDHGVPALNDAAADVPPLGRFAEILQQGFDLVAFSGGKAIRGPQASGLLLGRPDLIRAARLTLSPHMGLGRGMKVSKEAIAGLVAAVERFVTLDHDAEWRIWETRVAEMIDLLAAFPGITLARDVPEISNHSPHLLVEWSPERHPVTAEEVVRRLWAVDPPIAVLAEGERTLRIAVWTLRDQEHHVIAKRIQEIFKDP